MITQFFNTPQLSVNRTKPVLLSKKFKYNAVQNPKLNNHHTLVHAICAFLSREIADSLQLWSEKKMISDTAVKYFVEKADADIDYLENLYKRNNGITHFAHDFELSVSMFQKLADKSVSEFQKKSDPLLTELLTIIYAIRFIENNVGFIAWALGKFEDKNIMAKVAKKRNELESSFLKNYAEVSNVKDFDFGKFDAVFIKVRSLTHSGFEDFVDNL